MNVVVIVMAAVMAAAAGELRGPNPEVLRWQVEAQARERAMARAIDWRAEKVMFAAAAAMERRP